MPEDWKDVCSHFDCDDCPLDDFCSTKPVDWDIDKLYAAIDKAFAEIHNLEED